MGNEAPDKFHETNTLEQRVKDTETVISHILKNLGNVQPNKIKKRRQTYGVHID